MPKAELLEVTPVTVAEPSKALFKELTKAEAVDEYALEPKPLNEKLSVHARTVNGHDVLLSALPDGRLSLVVQTATYRAHTWGPAAAIKESAARLGIKGIAVDSVVDVVVKDVDVFPGVPVKP